MNRIRVVLVLLASTLLIAGCTHAPRIASPCGAGGGVNDPQAPIICIDDSQSVLSVDPKRFLIHESVKNNPAASPAVNWFTKSGRGDLMVRFTDERCVREVRCNGGHCKAKAARLTAGTLKEVCKYDVLLTGHPDLDPEGVLTGCCVSSEPDP